MNAPSGAVSLLGLACDLREQGKPSADELTDRVTKLLVGPACRDHLLQYPHVAGSRSSSRKSQAGSYAAIAGHPHRTSSVGGPGGALILLLQKREDETLLGAEVVVELAPVALGLVGHLTSRQAPVAVGQQPASAPRQG